MLRMAGSSAGHTQNLKETSLTMPGEDRSWSRLASCSVPDGVMLELYIWTGKSGWPGLGRPQCSLGLMLGCFY